MKDHILKLGQGKSFHSAVQHQISYQDFINKYISVYIMNYPDFRLLKKVVSTGIQGHPTLFP